MAGRFLRHSLNMKFIAIFLSIALLVEDLTCQEWMRMALVSSDIMNKNICDNISFWTERQRQLCLTYKDVISQVAVGAEMAYYECRYQFRWGRWNCSADNTKDKALLIAKSNKYSTLFGSNLVLDSKEAAFVSALFSAGVAHAVTKACSSNTLKSCSCDSSEKRFDKDGNKWHRCSDNIDFGTNFAKEFTDSEELNWSMQRKYTSHARNLMNLHNNEVGRKAIKKNMWRKCPCHGVSGSCTTKVCSREMPAFRFIGSFLKERFNEAIQVKLEYISTRQVLLPVNKHSKPVTDTQLVYLKPSPLYCESVKGRRCKVKKGSSGSCTKLCCGRGYHTKERNIVKNCKCTFIWCCRVECQKCRYRQKIHQCK